MTSTVLVRRSSAASRVDKVALPGLRPDPAALWSLLKGSPYRFWFDSGPGLKAGDRTLLAWGPPVWTLSGRDHRAELSRGGEVRRFSFRDPLELLRDLLGRDGSAEFSGGAAGFWSYESARYFEPAIRLRPQASRDAVPDFLWAAPEFWLSLDRRGAVLIRQPGAVGTDASLEDWVRKLKALPPETETRPSAAPAVYAPLQTDRRAYVENVRAALRYIAAGDIYQANLTQRFELPWPARRAPEDLFLRLRAINPSPYAALFAFPEFALVSCSPELLLRVRGRRISTRPIAGTRPRGRSPGQDEKLSGELLLSPKERAEHVMLLDLERNDLGRVCRPGTVRVSENMTLEKYSHVIHIVSQVEGVLRRGADGFDAVKALFPGGTITGCPKVRCMEIIRELEREPRGPFFGSAGWLGRNGDMDLNILIRTALIREGRLSLRVGAGIVADSDPDREFDETLQKAQALLQAYGAATAQSDPVRPSPSEDPSKGRPERGAEGGAGRLTGATAGADGKRGRSLEATA